MAFDGRWDYLEDLFVESKVDEVCRSRAEVNIQMSSPPQITGQPKKGIMTCPSLEIEASVFMYVL